MRSCRGTAGGFLQTVTFGFTGLRIHDDSLRLRPKLIEGTTAMRVRGVHYRGHAFDVRYDRLQLELQLIEASAEARCALCVSDEEGGTPQCLHSPGEIASFKLRANASTFAVRCIVHDDGSGGR